MEMTYRQQACSCASSGTAGRFRSQSAIATMDQDHRRMPAAVALVSGTQAMLKAQLLTGALGFMLTYSLLRVLRMSNALCVVMAFA